VGKQAEIIDIRTYRKHDRFEFLVHFDEFPDRRYDLWVSEQVISDVVKAENEDATSLNLSTSKKDSLRRATRNQVSIG
jgi:hypothetical protein